LKFQMFDILSGDKPRNSTKTMIGRDNKNLYVAVEADEIFMDRLKAKQFDLDGYVWENDSIEIFLDTNNDRCTFYQVCVDIKGQIYDSSPSNGTKWNYGGKAAVKKAKNGWMLEISIPLSKIGGVPEKGTKWGINVIRNRPAKGGEGVDGLIEMDEAENTACFPHYDKKHGMPECFGKIGF
jgi:hypothetical protein